MIIFKKRERERVTINSIIQTRNLSLGEFKVVSGKAKISPYWVV